MILECIQVFYFLDSPSNRYYVVPRLQMVKSHCKLATVIDMLAFFLRCLV